MPASSPTGALGSVLAAVATALPESVIPVVAILTGDETGQIAIGSILGAPFLLATLAMLLVGISTHAFAGRREQRADLEIHPPRPRATSQAAGASPLALALILAPLATELPEKANSILWSRRGKDALALGNITGALVFQSMVPVAVGLAFTPWALTTPSVLAIACALVGGMLALAAVLRRRRFSWPAMVGWGVLYAGFVIYVSFFG